MTHVMVNGKGPFRFVIDTGASRSTLAPHLARALGLKVSVGRNVMLNGVTGAAEVPTVAVDSLEIGALQIRESEPAGHLHLASWAMPTASWVSRDSMTSASTSTSSAIA